MFAPLLVFCLIHMVLQNPIALLLAVLLGRRGLFGRSFYRTVLFLPTVLSVVLVGFVWQLLLSPIWGVGERVFSAVGLGSYFGPFLGDESTALVTLSLISVWQFVGLPMLLFHAALVTIPEELFEAARLEGAGHWSVFRHIQLPLILPTLGVVTILTFIGNFNAFDLVYTTQGALGGPNFSTDLLGTLFYRTYFGYQLQAGQPHSGSALATVMFMIVLGGVLAYLLLWQRRLRTELL